MWKNEGVWILFIGTVVHSNKFNLYSNLLPAKHLIKKNYVLIYLFLMQHLEVDTDGSCWLPKDGDVVWIATKIPDVSV